MDAAARVPTTRGHGLADVVYRSVRESILGLELAPGAPLRQEEIALRLGVSRLPVREALQRLVAEELVEFRLNRGFFVASLTADEIAEVFDIRAILEERAGFHATRHRNAAAVAAVQAVLHQLDVVSVADELDVAAFGRLNAEFHARLFAASGRPKLCALLSGLRANVERYARLGASIMGTSALAQDEHRRIFEAFARGDADAVAGLCRGHCENTAARLLSKLATDANPGGGAAAGNTVAPR